MKDRLIELMKHYSLSKSDLAARCGISKAAVSHITSDNGRGGHFSAETLDKIIAAFPNVSREWLVNGTGSMTIADDGLQDGTPTLFGGNDVNSKVNINNSINSEKSVRREYVNQEKNATTSVVNPVNSTDYNKETNDGKTNVASDFAAKYIAVAPESLEKPNATIERIVVFYSDGTFVHYQPKKANN